MGLAGFGTLGMDDDLIESSGIGFKPQCQYRKLLNPAVFIYGTTMDEKMTESGMVDLYEEMLYERAAIGIRPVLYVSSRTDLECCVLMLLDEPLEAKLALPQRHASTRGDRHYLMTGYSRLRRGTV